MDQGLCPRTIFALARSEGRALILCLVNGEAGENHLHEARRRAAAVARPRVLALASRFAETWQHASGSTQHEKPELWLWSATDPTEPEPMRLSRLTPSTSRAETGGERDVSRPAPARLESPDPWSVTLAPGAARLSPEEIASLLDPPGAGTNPLEGAGA